MNKKEEQKAKLLEIIQANGMGPLENMKQAVCKHVEENFIVKPKTLKESLLFWAKMSLKGLFLYTPHYLFSTLILYFGFSLIYPITYLNCLGIFILLRAFKVGIVNKKTNDHVKNDE